MSLFDEEQQNSGEPQASEKPATEGAGKDPRALAALEKVRELCIAGQFRVQPEIRSLEGAYLTIELVGEDAASIFSKHGRMLDALQYVSNLIVARHVGPGIRLVLDADGYRARRRELLESLARKYAALVKEKQQECEFDPMPPHERRIIHRLFMNDPDVTTYSEGEEPDRKVILSPRHPAPDA